MPEFDQEWYTIGEAALILRCGEKAVKRLMDRCELPGRKHGGSYRFHREDLESMYERCERTGCWPEERR